MSGVVERVPKTKVSALIGQRIATEELLDHAHRDKRRKMLRLLTNYLKRERRC